VTDEASVATGVGQPSSKSPIAPYAGPLLVGTTLLATVQIPGDCAVAEATDAGGTGRLGGPLECLAQDQSLTAGMGSAKVSRSVCFAAGPR
jgi:hypothetical protein